MPGCFIKGNFLIKLKEIWTFKDKTLVDIRVFMSILREMVCVSLLSPLRNLAASRRSCQSDSWAFITGLGRHYLTVYRTQIK